MGDFRSQSSHSTSLLSSLLHHKHAARPILNALKYSVNFPLIYVSYLLMHPTSPQSHIRSVWLLFVTINTIFSTMWDLLVDWDLLMWPRLGQKGLLLRPQLVVFPHRPSVYYGAIAFDIVGRASWMLRLMALSYYRSWPGLLGLLDSDLGVFLLQLVEVLRRFVWLIFRLEAHHLQAVRPAATSTSASASTEHPRKSVPRIH